MKIKKHRNLEVHQLAFDYAFSCSYTTKEAYVDLNMIYENIIGKLVNMSQKPENWSW